MSNAKWVAVKHPFEDCPATAVVREGEDFCCGIAICFSGNGPEEARRIAASLNACDGMETDALERMPLPFSKLLVQDFQNVVAQRDELLEALEKSRGDLHNARFLIGKHLPDNNWLQGFDKAIRDMDSAIAKTKGGAA